jgi:anaerobic selenocysteine-containing dehydrogenase
VAEGDDVVVSTPSGTITLPAWLCDDIMPGVISVPHGWGHDREGVQLGVARKVAGQSVNDIIGSSRVEAVTAMAQLNGIPVTVEPAKGAKSRKKAG